MRLVRLTLALAAVALLPAASIAADPTLAAGAPTATAATAKPEKVKKVCRRAIDTGSIMPRSTCRTPAEWEAMTARSQDALQAARDHAGPNPGSASN